MSLSQECSESLTCVWASVSHDCYGRLASLLTAGNDRFSYLYRKSRHTINSANCIVVQENLNYQVMRESLVTVRKTQEQCHSSVEYVGFCLG